MKRFLFLVALAHLMFSNPLTAKEARLDAPAFPELASTKFSSARYELSAEKGRLITTPGAVFTEAGDYTGMILPELLSAPEPIPYPKWAAQQGWEGEVILAIEVMTDGSVDRYSVVQSTGHKILDETAAAVVRTWKFTPAMKDGKPVHTCVEIPIRFELTRE